MFIIPLVKRRGQRRVPIVTIGIILLNCIVFFVIQRHDPRFHGEAMEFYMQSDLSRIEIAQYQAYRNGYTAEPTWDAGDQGNMDEATRIALFMDMQNDHVFMKALLSEEIITPRDALYDTWKPLRTKYEAMLSRIVSHRYGLLPSKNRLLTVGTYMFLHGGLGHLLGNMVMLWLVGCVLELGLGGLVYTAIYLLTGVFAGELYACIYAQSTVPLIGASGAISGLMGAYTVAFGRRRIEVFYSLGFYFNYTKVPAIILLPVWVGNEVFQLLFGANTFIAYVAHIGGLASGAALVFLQIRFRGVGNLEVFEEAPDEAIGPLLEKALERVEALDMAGARPFLKNILDIAPGHVTAWTHLFNIDKLTPRKEHFEKTAAGLLGVLCRDKDHHAQLYETFREYCKIKKMPGLSPDLLACISHAFISSEHVQEAEKVIVMLLKKHPSFQKIPTLVFSLSRSYLALGMHKKREKCLAIISHRYPQSEESQMVKQLMASSPDR
jgi:membrane associated rhomboid family serine protease